MQITLRQVSLNSSTQPRGRWSSGCPWLSCLRLPSVKISTMFYYIQLNFFLSFLISIFNALYSLVLDVYLVAIFNALPSFVVAG